MSKIPCSQCNRENSSYIRWCLNCGSYCGENDDEFEPPSVARAVEDLFNSTVKSAKRDVMEHYEAPPINVRKSVHFSPQPSSPPATKIIPPKPVSSSFNPYYSNKKELEDYMRSSFVNWDTSCYQSISLRQSFMPDRSYKVEEPEQRISLPRIISNNYQNNNNDYDIIQPAAIFEVEEVEDERAEEQAIEAFDSVNFELKELALPFYDRALSPQISLPLPPTGDYGEFFQLTPRIMRGDESFLLSLPPEMLLYILSLLEQIDLIHIMLVCKKLKRLASDSTLWRSIVLRNRTLQDSWMFHLGQRKPQSLALVCCDGSDLSSSALAEMFRLLQTSLTAFTLRASSRGALETDNVILRLASQCGQKLIRLNLSWTSLTDIGLAVVSASFPNLNHLDLSGCQAIADNTFCAVMQSLGRSLQTLILCQNSKLTEAVFDSIAASCFSLVHLELNCFQTLADIHVDSICSASSRYLKTLSLENCKKLSDISIVAIGEFCSALESLNLAKNRQLTRQTVHIISEQLKMLKNLNLNRIVEITDEDLMLLARNCLRLQAVDLSQLPRITPEGVLSFIASCTSLRALTLTGCSKIGTKDRNFFKQNAKHSISIVI